MQQDKKDEVLNTERAERIPEADYARMKELTQLLNRASEA